MGLRNIFDGLYVDQLFHKNQPGETVFYPHGMLGRGYVLPPELEPSIRSRVRLRMLVALVVGISFANLALRIMGSGQSDSPAGWAVLAAIGGLLLAGLFYFQSRLTAGLSPTTEARPSAGEWLRRGRQARATWTYWTSAVVGAFMLVSAAFAVALALADGDLFTVSCAIVMVVIGALLAWDGTLGLMERWLGE